MDIYELDPPVEAQTKYILVGDENCIYIVPEARLDEMKKAGGLRRMSLADIAIHRSDRRLLKSRFF